MRDIPLAHDNRPPLAKPSAIGAFRRHQAKPKSPALV